MMQRQSPRLWGGWASVKKLDPELWQKVLDQVRKEDKGPWAAWKAKKAIELYKAAGGRYENGHS